METVHFEPSFRDNTVFYSLEPMNYLMNQSESSILLEAHNNPLLNYHYRFETSQNLDVYTQNLL